MSEYTAIFDARGGHDNLADHRHPFARGGEGRIEEGPAELGPGEDAPPVRLPGRRISVSARR